MLKHHSSALAGNGVIDLDEFVGLSSVLDLSEVQLKGRFKQKDILSSGHITVEEAREIVQEMRSEQVARGML